MVWKAKPISKEMCLAAMAKTKSVKAAARYLNCSYQHLKPFMQSYIDEETGKSLFELHKNQCGKGVPKFLAGKGSLKNEPPIQRVLNGEIDSSHFSVEKLKYKLLGSGLIEDQCMSCGFSERRVVDGKMPVILHFKDGDRRHFVMTNIVLSCYNCYFLQYGRVFNESDLKSIEDNTPYSGRSEAFDMELDDYHRKRLDELGLFEDKITNDPYDLVSRKK